MNVAILLSTHDGARYLPSLLDSLAAQTWPSWRLVVRDDGSKDDTRRILDAFAAAHPGRVEVEAGDNLGAAASFLRLLGRRDLAADAVALCDQDDVWHPDKLERAVARLRGRGATPCLYCSRVELVDADLRPLGLSPLVRGWGFESALFENVAIGCTIVLNRAASDLLAERLPAADAVGAHDWWCYLAVAAVGEVVYDPRPTLGYRLHGGNAVGLPVTDLGRLAQQARRLRREPSAFFPIHRQAAALLEQLGDLLPPARRRLVAELVACRDRPLRRLRLALRAPVRRQRRLDAAVARLLIALGAF